MKALGTTLILAATSIASAQSQTNTRPLPTINSLVERAITQSDTYARARQHFHCYYRSTGNRTSEQYGHTSRIYESFFYHGREVTRTVALGRRRLATDEQADEQKRVDAQERAIDALPLAELPALPGGTTYSDQPAEWDNSVEAAILRTAKFSNEHRIVIDGRATIAIDFEGIPQPGGKHVSQAEAAAAHTAGTALFDETDGALIRLQGHVTSLVVTQKNQILTAAPMNIDYRATRINGDLYVPSHWSDGKIDVQAKSSLRSPAVTVFFIDTVDLIGCEEEHVHSTIQPTTP